MHLLIPARQFMALPEAALARSYRNEPVDTRLFLTWRICQHKRMNLDKPNADRIPIRSLLACCPSIISYRELAQGHVSQRIIEPFKHALDKCDPYFSWQFDGSEEPEDYPTFLQAHIFIQCATTSRRLAPGNGSPRSPTASGFGFRLSGHRRWRTISTRKHPNCV